MKPAVPQAAVGPETSIAARRTFGRSSEENSSAGSFPQQLARQAWGRCLAISIKTVYSALVAWHPAGFSVWVVSHSPSPLRGNPLGRLIGWRPVLSVVGYLQGLIRVVVPFTSLLHPGREVAVGPQLLIRWEIPTPLAASLYIVIVISEFLKRYSKAKRTSLFTSAATNQRGVKRSSGPISSVPGRGQSSC